MDWSVNYITKGIELEERQWKNRFRGRETFGRQSLVGILDSEICLWQVWTAQSFPFYLFPSFFLSLSVFFPRFSISHPSNCSTISANLSVTPSAKTPISRHFVMHILHTNWPSLKIHHISQNQRTNAFSNIRKFGRGEKIAIIIKGRLKCRIIPFYGQLTFYGFLKYSGPF